MSHGQLNTQPPNESRWCRLCQPRPRATPGVGGTQQAQLQHGLAEAVVEKLHVALLRLQLRLSVRSASL